MNTRTYLLSILLLLFGTTFFACNDDPDPEPELTPREKVVKAYNDEYLGTELADPGWTGSVAGCVAGTNSQEANDLTLRRINYFRELVGLPGDITFNATYNANCMQAALIMKANNSLSHYPPSGWTCWNQVGYDAAGSSNLAWSSNSGANGNHTTNAVSGYIEDPGGGNERVGHRRWLLFSKAKVMGQGSTTNTNAIWVSGNDGNPIPSSYPEFVAYPTKDYMPAPLVFPRWSFSKPEADFLGANVAMTDQNGTAVPLTVVHREQAGGSYVGDNTIVWEPQGINTTGVSDVTYHVTVSNVTVNGSPQTFNYDVIIIQPNITTKQTQSARVGTAEAQIK